jgi:hypothetical protein
MNEQPQFGEWTDDAIVDHALQGDTADSWGESIRKALALACAEAVTVVAAQQAAQWTGEQRQSFVESFARAWVGHALQLTAWLPPAAWPGHLGREVEEAFGTTYRELAACLPPGDDGAGTIVGEAARVYERVRSQLRLTIPGDAPT